MAGTVLSTSSARTTAENMKIEMCTRLVDNISYTMIVLEISLGNSPMVRPISHTPSRSCRMSTTGKTEVSTHMRKMIRSFAASGTITDHRLKGSWIFTLITSTVFPSPEEQKME